MSASGERRALGLLEGLVRLTDGRLVAGDAELTQALSEVNLPPHTRHNCIGHSYTGHNYMGHNYIGHNYMGHDYIGHNYIGHN